MMVSVDEHANVFAQENKSVRQVGPFVMTSVSTATSAETL